MYIVLAAGGHIGSELIKSLTSTGQEIIAITRDAKKAHSITGGTVRGMEVDIGDPEALRDVFRMGKRAFLLVPQAPPTTDTNTAELRMARAIANAVDGSGLQKVLVVSTYGAQEGDGIGDLSVLWEFEKLIRETGVPMAINRGAYYYTNIDMLVESARGGEVATPFPENLAMPMVSPIDLGKAAAARLTSPVEDVGVRYFEGPQRYTFADVAALLSDALGRHVHLRHIPRESIKSSYLDQGFSEPAAQAFTNMTLASLDGPELPDDPVSGEITLDQHIRWIVEETGKS